MTDDEIYELLTTGIAEEWNNFRKKNNFKVLEFVGKEFVGFTNEYGVDVEILKSKNLNNCRFIQCTFSKVSFNMDLEEVHFVDTRFLKYVSFTNLKLIRTVFRNCRFLTGAIFSKVLVDFGPALDSFENVTFLNTRFSQVKIVSKYATLVKFDRCTFDDLTFNVFGFLCSTFSENKIIQCDLNLMFFDESCDISHQQFDNCDLTMVRFHPHLFSELNLNGAKINPGGTNYYPKSHFQIGKNGIYNPATNSCAFIPIKSEPNSMLGNNPEVIVESIKRARYFMNISLSMIAILYLLTHSLEPDFSLLGVKVKVNLAKELCYFISMGSIVLCIMFASDALSGMSLLRSKKDAMIIANFPWIISRYAKSKWPNKRRFPSLFSFRGLKSYLNSTVTFINKNIGKKSVKSNIQHLLRMFVHFVYNENLFRYRFNLFIRFMVSMHPFVTIWLLYKGEVFPFINSWTTYITVSVSAVLAFRLFYISQNFQKTLFFPESDSL